MNPVAALGAAAFVAGSLGGSFLGTAIAKKVLPSKTSTSSWTQTSYFDLSNEMSRLFPQK